MNTNDDFPLEIPKYVNRTVRCFVFQCRNLPAADSDGNSDPFITVQGFKSKARTATFNDNLNPIFMEHLDFEIQVDKNAAAVEDECPGYPPILLNIFDEDAGLFGRNSADYLGRATVFFKKTL